jgi:hypothetical protein
MRRLTASLVAAAAATALILIPLAVSPASAATYTPPTQANNSITRGNWSGYLLTATGKNRFSYVYAEFTVPKVSNGKVFRGPNTAPGNTMALWAGFGGVGGTQLEQGGIEAGDNAKGQVYYWAFSQEVPSAGGGAGPIAIPLDLVINGSGVPGKAITIHAGDKMSIDVVYADNPGDPYEVFVTDSTQNKYGAATITKARGADKTAEIITEATGGGPANDLAGFFEMPPITYTECYASVGGSPGLKLPYSNPWGISPEPMWKTTRVTMGGIKVQILPPPLPATFYKTIEVPSALSVPGGWNAQGGGGLGFTSFSTKWDLTR